MSDELEFSRFVSKNAEALGADSDFSRITMEWLCMAIGHNYAQNFTWLSRPIIQIPQDIYAVQELIWKVRPDLVIETGIARGGSLVLSASILALLDYCDAVEQKNVLDPLKSNRKVLGIDIDIRHHNFNAIHSHPLAHMIKMLEGSSVDEKIINKVNIFAKSYKKILIFLDSNHTHAHVLAELHAYAPLVSKGSYCVIWDTGVEDLPENFIINRPWGKGNNPKTATFKYLEEIESLKIKGVDGNPLEFSLDKELEHRLKLTASPDGFLLRK